MAAVCLCERPGFSANQRKTLGGACFEGAAQLSSQICPFGICNCVSASAIMASVLGRTASHLADPSACWQAWHDRQVEPWGCGNPDPNWAPLSAAHLLATLILRVDVPQLLDAPAASPEPCWS